MAENALVKYVFVVDEAVALILNEPTRSHLDNFTGKEDSQCQVLKRPLQVDPIFTEIYTVNNFWMQITFKRIWESGLAQIWDKWAFWNFELSLKTLKDHCRPNQYYIAYECIDLYKILPCFVAWFIGLFVVAGFCFLFENHHKLLAICCGIVV